MAILGDTKAISLTLLDGVIGNLLPKTTTVYDLGSSSLKWNNVYATTFNGNATSATKATLDGNGATISSTYLKLSGGTLTGVLTAKGSMYEDSYSGALNMNNSNIYGLNSIYTADSSDNAAEGIHFYRDSTHVDTLWMSGGDLLFVPNRALGTSTTKANSQKVGRFTANPTTDLVVVADGTTGGIKTTGYTIAKSVPSDALFTDTWNALSTSLAGYVAQAPNDTGKFLRGDATWAAVTASNVGLGNVENTKLSTWTGSTAITTLGTIATGSIPLNNITSADDLKAIEALTGTSGLLKKTAANTWTLDTTAYTSNTGTVTSVRVLATSPLVSSTDTAQSSTLNTTISFSFTSPNYVLAGPTSIQDPNLQPSFRALVEADIPNISISKITGGTLGVARGGTGAESFTANSLIMSGSTTTAALTTRAITNNTSATAAATGTNIPTMNTLYYALPKINNDKTYTSDSTFYAPTAGGTSGYVLVGNGTTSAPTWSLTVAVANGGTGATTADAARTNLGIILGSITCTTAAATLAKIGNADKYTLLPGYFSFYLANSNTYNGKITLNIYNGTIAGATRDVYINGIVTSSTNKEWLKGYYIGFYDGTVYHFRTDGALPGLTATVGTNNTLLATTAFVNTAITNAIGTAIGGSY